MTFSVQFAISSAYKIAKMSSTRPFNPQVWNIKAKIFLSSINKFRTRNCVVLERLPYSHSLVIQMSNNNENGHCWPPAWDSESAPSYLSPRSKHVINPLGILTHHISPMLHPLPMHTCETLLRTTREIIKSSDSTHEHDTAYSGTCTGKQS